MNLQFWRRRLYEVFEQGSADDMLSVTFNRALIFLIVATTAATVMESVPAFALKYSALFLDCEIAATVIFSIEYVLRLWTAVEHRPLRHLGPLSARVRFALSFAGLIDLIAILPFWLSVFVAADFRTILIVRLLRFLKLTRYSPAMRSLLEALNSERRALFGCFVILCGATVIMAALMHLIEGGVQPDKFGTIPEAMWWAIVTLGTVGYGDVVPITTLGRLLAGVTIFMGLIMVALPIGIIATAFSNEVHRRDFVVTWGILARIPLFGELTAIQIADIMKCLRAQKVEAGTTIARRGEQAHSMYLIVDGEVEIRFRHKRIRLGAGHFFGEIAALRRARRSATVMAAAPTRLLSLDTADLHEIMEREPQIASRIYDAARTRLHELETAEGDLILEELEEAKRR